MTEASKLRTWARGTYLPSNGTNRCKTLKRSTPPTVTTTGVSCRMGVGGRRGRKRRRATARTIGGYWFLFTPKNMERPNPFTRVYREFEKAFTGMATAAAEAGKAVSRLALAARAPTAARPSP